MSSLVRDPIREQEFAKVAALLRDPLALLNAKLSASEQLILMPWNEGFTISRQGETFLYLEVGLSVVRLSKNDYHGQEIIEVFYRSGDKFMRGGKQPWEPDTADYFVEVLMASLRKLVR